MPKMAAWGRKILDYLETNPAKGDVIRYVEALSEIGDQQAPEYFGPEAKPIGHRAYDSLINGIFQAVLRGVPREELLKDALTALTRKEIGSPAVCLFVLEGTVDASRSIAGPVTLKFQHRLNPNVWSNFAAESLPSLAASPFIQGLLAQRNAVELWLSSFITSYAGEFDMLMSAAKGKGAIKHGYWIAGVPLPPARTNAQGRAVVALYDNQGSEFSPEVPHGASQDWRLLQFLGLAHRVLDHQLESLAEQVHGQRNQMLTQLAPGIMHHEIGHRLNNLVECIDILDGRLKRMAEAIPSEQAQKLQEPLKVLRKECDDILAITDAFNNLERRRANERLDFGKLFREVAVLAHHRLGKEGAFFRWPDSAAETHVETDPALLLHLVFNIVINALAAFASPDFEKPATGRQISASVTIKSRAERPIIVEIVNNGPPIPAKIRETIFEKGFTTRPDGHGQGLYICRLIAGALGGRLSLVDENELGEDWTVGFRIELPERLEQNVDLMGSRRQKA